MIKTISAVELDRVANKRNTEDEPARLPDNQSVNYQIRARKIMHGMMGYSSHRNPENKKKFNKDSFVAGTFDDWQEVLPMMRKWYRQRFALDAPVLKR